MTTTADWFRVDKKGLAQIVERRGKSWILYELLSNAWDETTTRVDVRLEPHDGKPLVTITVTDDNPDGFKDLTDAWTLFAPSKKKGDAEKRGRFNLGEKLVLAMCDSALIKTTTGAVLFDHQGRHNRPKWKTEKGSEIEAEVRMTRAELGEMLADAQRLIVPLPTFINGKAIETRFALRSFEAFLPTEISDPEGTIKRTSRKTLVKLYPVEPGETASIYEMGIPIVETGDAFHIDVMQKVPLNMERDNVTPSYLRTLRALVLTHAHERLKEEDKAEAWVTDAIASPTFDPENLPEHKEALDEVLTARFGIARVSYDPSDREANNIAVSRGHTVVAGGSLPAEVWSKAKATGLIKPAGQVTPSPKPFSDDGAPLHLLDESELGAAVRAGIEVYRWVGYKLLGFTPEVRVADSPEWTTIACYARKGDRAGRLILNLARAPMIYRVDIYDLAIHEYAHHEEENHLAEKFHETCCRFGAKLAAFFDEFGDGRAAIVDDRKLGELSLDLSNEAGYWRDAS